MTDGGNLSDTVVSDVAMAMTISISVAVEANWDAVDSDACC